MTLQLFTVADDKPDPVVADGDEEGLSARAQKRQPVHDHRISPGWTENLVGQARFKGNARRTVKQGRTDVVPPGSPDKREGGNIIAQDNKLGGWTPHR